MHDSYQVLHVQSLLTQVPVVLVVLAGLLIAGYRWKRYPRVSSLVTVALCLFLIASVGGRLVPHWLGGQEVRSLEDYQRFQRTMFIIGRSMNLTSAVAICSLLWAAFGWRRSDPDVRGDGRKSL